MGEAGSSIEGGQTGKGTCLVWEYEVKGSGQEDEAGGDNSLQNLGDGFKKDNHPEQKERKSTPPL